MTGDSYIRILGEKRKLVIPAHLVRQGMGTLRLRFTLKVGRGKHINCAWDENGAVRLNAGTHRLRIDPDFCEQLHIQPGDGVRITETERGFTLQKEERDA